MKESSPSCPNIKRYFVKIMPFVLGTRQPRSHLVQMYGGVL